MCKAITSSDLNNAASDPETLRLYTRRKQAIAGQIRLLQRIIKERGNERRAEQCQELMVKLAEDRFTLAVLGQFKRGKSSLMNAIMGREVLPVGVLPLTSAITVLKYGPAERLVIQRDALSYPQEAPLSQLAEYVTENGNPGNVKRVRTACLELPLPFLRRGMEFVDTPGIGSAIEANTATTYGFLPNCDATVFVTSVDTPLTAIEVEFLQRIRQYVHKVFFVINKTDLLGETERQEVLDFIQNAIHQQVQDNTVKVFPLSSRLGLTARLNGNADAYAKSGMKDFEDALAIFLSNDKTATFLGAIIDKAGRILGDELEDIERLMRSQQSLETVDAKTENQYAPSSMNFTLWRQGLERIEANLSALRNALTQTGPTAEQTLEQLNIVQKPATKIETVRIPAEQFDIAKGLMTRGCPLCSHLLDAALRFYSNWQYELASNENAQAGFAADLGFCPLHTWQLLAVSSPHGASLGWTPLVERVARKLLVLLPSSGVADAVKSLIPGQNCRVCHVLREAEREYVKRLAEFLRDSENQRKYAQSQGLCLRHLSLVISAVPEEIASMLLSEASRHLSECAEDMQSYSLKHEAIRRGLVNQDEEDAYLRAAIRLVSERNVLSPWKMDGEI
jgi:GTP-binding protein EngB required for normal cell division